MSERTLSKPKANPASVATEETFGSVWRKYCADSGPGQFDMPPLRRAFNNVAARLKYRHVHRIAKNRFNQISLAGYDVQEFEDVAAPLEPERTPLRNLPEKWNALQQAFAPKIAKLQGAVVFGNGAILLPEKRLIVGGKTMFEPPDFFLRAKEIVYFDRSRDSALIQRHMRCMDLPGRCFTANRGKFWNFGHFVHDVLSLIYYEDLGAIVPGRD